MTKAHGMSTELGHPAPNRPGREAGVRVEGGSNLGETEGSRTLGCGVQRAVGPEVVSLGDTDATLAIPSGGPERAAAWSH